MHSLYIHIPFCTSRCRYCNFYFETGWSPRIMQRTLEGILQESRRHYHPGFFSARQLKTIYIGGGTPSTVPPDQFDSFLRQLTENLRRTDPSWNPGHLREFCVECNPESLSQALLEVLHNHGVSRISLGVQCFQDDLLHTLGRRATRGHALDALNLLSGFWKGDFNVDLITGIPGQTRPNLLADLDTARGFDPAHISVYSLTIEPRTPLEQYIRAGLAPLPEQEYDTLWFIAHDYLETHGYTNYEISNFARPGAESAHNLSYWAMTPYIGLGPGAVSTLPTGNPRQPAIRTTNPDIFAYSPPSRPLGDYTPHREHLSPWELLADHILTATRTRRGLSRSLLNTRFSLDLPSGRGFPPAMDDLVLRAIRAGAWAEEWIDSPDALSLTNKGRFAHNAVILDLLSSLSELIQNFSLLSTWP